MTDHRPNNRPAAPRPLFPKQLGDFLGNGIERLLFASRWILAPFYVGLALALLILLVKFVGELWHIAKHALHSTEAQVILGVLTLVDLALTGSLLIIVIFSGYENFVSKIDHTHHEDWPSWMGTIDFTALKLKLLSLIVAISAIQLLKQFVSLKAIPDRDLIWYVVIHLVFVVSSVLLALSDRIVGGSHVHEPAPPPSEAKPHIEAKAAAPPHQAPGQHGGERRRA